MFLNKGSASSSSDATGFEPVAAGNAVETTNLLVSAPVGQETMHSPQETHEESPIGLLLSKAMRASAPLPIRPSTRLPRTSSQPRMQRSHKMQASRATLMA